MPAIYTPEIADRICAGRAAGKTVAEVCREVGMLPYEYYQWRREVAEFREAIEAAGEDCSHAIADSCVEIADTCEEEGDAIRKADLRCRQRQWYARVLNPQRYGDKLELAGNAKNPPAFLMRVVFVAPGDPALTLSARPVLEHEPSS